MKDETSLKNCSFIESYGIRLSAASSASMLCPLILFFLTALCPYTIAVKSVSLTSGSIVKPENNFSPAGLYVRSCRFGVHDACSEYSAAYIIDRGYLDEGRFERLFKVFENTVGSSLLIYAHVAK